MEAVSKQRALLLCAAGLGASAAITWLFLTRRYKTRQLRRVGEVSQLFLYPVKSCRGIPLQEAECREYGLKNGALKDRHWLVVKEDNVFVTARQEPRMVLITATCDEGHLTLAAPEMAHLRIPLKLPETNADFTCKIHGNEVQGRDCGEEASEWMTSYLKSQTYWIVYFEDTMKLRNPKNEYPLYTEDDQVAYPDLAPFLLLSEASLKHLNTKLEKKVSTKNFRPNIMVSGCDAFAEDTWQELQIGSEVTLKRVMPCPRSASPIFSYKLMLVVMGSLTPSTFFFFVVDRCILTTVDPETGVINMKEPLETLRSYRLCDTPDRETYKSAPLFGQYLKLLKWGTLRVGDPVYQITY
ncbi:Mitochondrial amidoxime reducing component [Pristimantis euphronides]